MPRSDRIFLLTFVSIVCTVLVVVGIILAIIFIDPDTLYPDILPEEGVWFCEELNCTLDFAEYTASIRYEGKQFDHCIISGEHNTNDLFVAPEHDSKPLWGGVCVHQDGETMIIDTEEGQYVFIRQESGSNH